MSYLHYYFIVIFTLGIYQSYGFLPFSIRKLNILRDTAMDTKYIKNRKDKDNLEPLLTLSNSSRPDFKYYEKPKRKPLLKVLTYSPKLKPYKTNRYVNGKIKSNDLRTVTFEGNTGDRTNTRHYYNVINLKSKTIPFLISEDFSIDSSPNIGVIGIKRTISENEFAEKSRTLPQPSILKRINTALWPIPKVITDIGLNDLVTDASNARKTIGGGYVRVLKEDDTYYNDQVVEKPLQALMTQGNLLKLARTSLSSHQTSSLLGTPDFIKELESGEIGPIRIFIKDDTNFEADYTSLTKKSHKIAFFDITKATVKYKNRGDLNPPDDSSVVKRTSSYKRLDHLTRTSQITSVYNKNTSIQTYTIHKDTNFDSNEMSGIEKPIRILIADDLNAKPDNETEYDYIEEEDFTVIPKATLIGTPRSQQDSWTGIYRFQKNITLAYDEIPETDDVDMMSSSRTSQMSTPTQKIYYKESMSNTSYYLPYSLSSTWPTLTFRNYFGQLFNTHKKSNIKNFLLFSQTAPSTFPHFPSKNDNDVTMQINILTGDILSPRPRKFFLHKLTKAKRQKRKTKNDAWWCFTCGMNQTMYGESYCEEVFTNGRRQSYLRHKHHTRCSGPKKYHGQCFKRYLDVGKTYNERGCRSFPPAHGKSYASKLFMKLEYLLKTKDSGCVSSPHAVLMPFSKNIQLYARVHVCVCKGHLCNEATSVVFDWSLTSLSIILLVFILVI